MQAGRRVRFTLRVFDGAGRKAERGGERVSGNPNPTLTITLAPTLAQGPELPLTLPLP